MKTFYSLIRISPNEMSGDTLTVGLFLSTPNGFVLKFSKNKKNICKSLFNSDSKIIDFLEKELTEKVKEQNKLIVENRNKLFEYNSFFTDQYFKYLSKYSNGLLKFSEPSMIADNIDGKKFEQLFKILVDSSEITHEDRQTKKVERDFFDKVDSKLIVRVKDKVHTNQTIDSKIVPSLFSPFQIDCIGLNGVLIGAKALSFTQSKETLHKSVNTYISVIAQLSSKYKKAIDNNSFYLIADEPQKKLPEHKLWKQLFNEERLLKVISSDESDKIAEIIEQKHASKFLN